MLGQVLAGMDGADSACSEKLLRAVFIVLADYQRAGRQPGAERWTGDTRDARHEMIRDVIAEWRTEAGGTALFPWHEDFVAFMWVRARKLSKPVKREMCEYLEIAVPPKWNVSTVPDEDE